MGKRENARGKYSHGKPSVDRSKHWKYGKSSGKADYFTRFKND